MIDAALADGRVRVIPAGCRALSEITLLVYDPQTYRLTPAGKLRAQAYRQHIAGDMKRRPE